MLPIFLELQFPVFLRSQFQTVKDLGPWVLDEKRQGILNYEISIKMLHSSDYDSAILALLKAPT